METLWNGTVDNLELSGEVNGDKQPMRVVRDGDGHLTTEFAMSIANEDGEIEYSDTTWIADSSMRFRDMEPAPDVTLRQRLIEARLIER